MIRIIFKHVNCEYGDGGGSERVSFHSIDIQNEEVEKELTRGGHGQFGYEFTNLVGAEVVNDE